MTTTTRSHSYTLPIRNDLAGQVYSSPEFPELRVTYVSAEAQRIHLQFNNTPIILDAKDITEGQAHLADDRYQIKVTDALSGSLSFTIEDQLQSYPLNQSFEVKLDENLTTGYAWEVEVTPGLRILQDKLSTQCPPGILGCGGSRVWTLMGITRGDQVFTGRYKRPWESESASIKILKFRIF